MSQKVIVSTKNGKVLGIEQKSNFSGTRFYSFYGIPYGEPPVENLRFKDPVKVKPWKSTRDATIPREGCLQYSLKYFNIVGSEDCLYVNVYTPELPTPDTMLKPVIVFIHPGGYFWGSPDPANHGSPNFIMQCDVVYVTICFRLHILGFLNLGLAECSGNQGLKDIIMALEWVQENIHNFNGNAKNVTLVGHSSGAGVIHFLMLSPAVKDLFHKAAMLGSYAFNPLVLRGEHTPIERNFEYGRSLGFDGTSKKQLLQYFKQLPAEIFVEQLRHFVKNSNLNAALAFPSGLFGPTVDKGKNAVLPMEPRKLIPSMKRIPLMVGLCQHETIIAFADTFKPATEKHMKTALRQNCWGWAADLSDAEIEFVNKQIESFYLKDHSKDVPLFIKERILSDASYSDLYETLIDLVSADLPSSVFVYEFQYNGEIAEMKPKLDPRMEDQRLEGTYHADDLGYWAHSRDPSTTQTKQVVHTYTKLISNFAKTGNPTCEGISVPWKPSTPNNPCYLQINETLQMTDGRLSGDRHEFWQRLKKQFNRNMIPEHLDE